MAQAPDSSAPVRMVVDLTVDDYAAFTAYAYQRPALRRRRRASHLRFAVLLAAGLLAVILLRVWDGGQLDWGAALPAYGQALAVGLAVFALLAAGYEYVLPRLARGNVRRALGRQPDNPFLGRHTLDFGPRGVDDAAAGASGTMPWEAVAQVEETASHLYLFISPLQGVIIPKRGQPADVLQAVRAQLRAHVPGAVLAGAADKQ